MADYEIAAADRAVHSKHLSAGAADSVVLHGPARALEVLSDGAADLYFALDAPATVGGADCYRLPAGAPSALAVDATRASGQPGEPTLTVSLISAGTPTYSVTRITGDV